MRHGYAAAGTPAAALIAKTYANNGVVTNDTTTLLSALTGTTSVLPVGDYNITVAYGWNASNPTTDFIGEFLFDGVSILPSWGGAMHRQEPVSAAGGDIDGTQTNQAYAFSRTFYRSFGAAATHTFDLQFASELAGARVSIFDPVVTFQQIS